MSCNTALSKILNLGSDVEDREPSYTVGGMCSHCGKQRWRFLGKIKIDLPYDPAIPFLGICPGKTIIQKDTCTPMFIAALFTIAKTWKQPECPSTEEWVKIWYMYTMEYYSAIKEQNNAKLQQHRCT